MSGNTSIEWCTDVWNPTAGCDQVSPGCDHCYAMTMAKRLKGMGQDKYQLDGDPRTSGPGFLAHEWPAALDWPLTVHKPMRVFVNSMSDLFHKNITDDYIAKVFAVMSLADRHTFQVLTKRPARMRSLLRSEDFQQAVWDHWEQKAVDTGRRAETLTEGLLPLRNVWLGVSVESQQWADIRIPALLDTPAAVRFLSCEPLLGPVDLSPWLPGRTERLGCPDCAAGEPHACPFALVDRMNEPRRTVVLDHMRDQLDSAELAGIDWVIVGGESGPGARPMHPDWARSLRDQCTAAGVPFLVKQWGEYQPSGQGIGRLVHERFAYVGEPDEYGWRQTMERVGKKAAGRELDGRTWDEYPTAIAVVGLA